MIWLRRDMLEAESGAMLQQASKVWKERHFSPSCQEEMASCDSSSLLPSPRFIFDTAAIDKTLKEQEVSLAEAAGRATCGYTANEPKWSTLLKGMNKFPSVDCIINSRLLAVLNSAPPHFMVKGTLSPAPPLYKFYYRQRRERAAKEEIRGRVDVQPEQNLIAQAVLCAIAM